MFFLPFSVFGFGDTLLDFFQEAFRIAVHLERICDRIIVRLEHLVCFFVHGLVYALLLCRGSGVRR